MGAKTDYLENKIVDWFYRGQPYTPPATLYVGLIVATRGASDAVRGAAVALGDTVVPAAANGHLYRCTTAGTTGAGEPAWPTAAGGTVADGAAVWTEMTPDLEAGNANIQEPSGAAAYGRLGVAASLANFAGTQGAGTTTASNGSGGTTSNNGAVSFATTTASWGVVWGFGLWDAAAAGNLLVHGALNTPMPLTAAGMTASFAAGVMTIQEDD